ncbi:hypothetical protein C8J56DRAFT_883648 [Mycena floridula]|nr:hypothetical protein C8J56DRAFT_883648 [Mycena floridula]
MSSTPQPGPLADSDVYALKEMLVITAVQFVVHGNILAGFLFYVLQLPELGFSPPDVYQLMVNLKILINILTRVQFLISDSIVVWRAWVIWNDHRQVHTLLVFCLIGSAVGTTIDFTFATLWELGNDKFTPTGPRTLIMILPLLLTNLIATALIGYKVWYEFLSSVEGNILKYLIRKYRAELKRCLGSEAKKKTQVERVLILLTESGTIYCLIWVVYFSIDLLGDVTSSLEYQLTTALLPKLTAIYPIFIILLITLDKANLESTVAAATLSQPIQFGTKPQVTIGTSSDINTSSTNTHTISVELDQEDNSVEHHQISLS